MKDIQSGFDERNETIDKVGVKNLKYPIVLQDRNTGLQSTIADIDFFVELPHYYRGTHMSRFIEVLNSFHKEDIIDNLPKLLAAVKEKLIADRAFIKLRFPYFIAKQAPVSGIESLMSYDCFFEASLADDYELRIGADVPVNTTCPCSKELSDYGAHNQRSIISVRVTYEDFVWLEDIIDYAEQVSSIQLYSLLKRSDEKYVTEQAYNNAKFVEDIVRDLAILLKKDDRITGFKVSSENMESIHNHNAYASIEWQR